MILTVLFCTFYSPTLDDPHFDKEMTENWLILNNNQHTDTIAK